MVYNVTTEEDGPVGHTLNRVCKLTSDRQKILAMTNSLLFYELVKTQ